MPRASARPTRSASRSAAARACDRTDADRRVRRRDRACVPTARTASGSIGTSRGRRSGRPVGSRPSSGARSRGSMQSSRRRPASAAAWVTSYAGRLVRGRPAAAPARELGRADGRGARSRAGDRRRPPRPRRAAEADGGGLHRGACSRRAGRFPRSSRRRACIPTSSQTMGGRVAYFLVDAIRFEMGVELRDQLQGAEELALRPAVAMLPTITPVGMAALLPGASASFSVVEQQREARARDRADASCRASPSGMRFLKAKVPDVVDLTLDEAARARQHSKLETTIGDASLVLVRSQEIDLAGERIRRLRAVRSWTPSIGEHRAGGAEAREPPASSVRRHRRPRAPVRVAQGGGHADRRHRVATRSSCTGAAGSGAAARRRRGRSASPPPSSATTATSTSSSRRASASSRQVADSTYHHGGSSLQEMVIPVRDVPDSGDAEPRRRAERRSPRGRARRDHEPHLQRAPHARSARRRSRCRSGSCCCRAASRSARPGWPSAPSSTATPAS